MQKINWIILKNKDRGTDYGVGTFIKQLSSELACKVNVNVFILEIGITTSKSFSIVQQNNITIFEIPTPYDIKSTDTKSNQEKFARNISRIISQYITGIGSKNIIHMNYVFQYFIATSLKKTFNGRIIFTQHLFIPGQKLEKNYFDTETHTYYDVDHIITVTQHGKKHLTKKGVDAKKIKCIYNGLCDKNFKRAVEVDVKKKYGLPENDKLILYSGRIDPIKGLDYLCRAMESLIKKIPNCRLVIAGEGDFKSLIESSRKFCANISFLGFIPFEDVVALYRQADIGVIPSLEEHCSYVALEMLHCGLPVVASNLGGLKEIFIHGENALLTDTIIDKSNNYGIAPRIEDLKNNIYHLLTRDSLRAKFTHNSKIRANSLFTANNMTNHYLQIANV
ncbi:glycosyltransferase family 4 protein [uncultured Draconibacterium sp.]|uniref:glycosyltransferase family 4 protein n=1 Tax=uncultured Draconibacterium sp. TaxID=1573823 RepID=UPI0029C7803A|nr:glycosyltransferase family 4 protein [uncultured Draconibacterium sp.]